MGAQRLRPSAAGSAALGLALCLLLSLTACVSGKGSSSEPAAGQQTLRIASYDFGESQTLAQLYATAIRQAGFHVEVIGRLGTRELVVPALQQGRVDAVIDYIGSALAFIEPDVPVSQQSGAETRQALAARLSPRGISVLDAAPAQDKNGFAMTNIAASALGVSRLSQLKPIAPSLTFGGPPECPSRSHCLPGLRRVYGLKFASFTPIESRYATAAALSSKEIDVGLLETTDARMASGQFVQLADDLNLQPPENIVPLVRTKLLASDGTRLSNAINAVSARLTTAGLVKLNRAVEIDGRSASEVAAEWLRANVP